MHSISVYYHYYEHYYYENTLKKVLIKALLRLLVPLAWAKANGAQRMVADCNLLENKVETLVSFNKFLFDKTAFDVCSKKKNKPRINVACFYKLWALC